MIIQNKIRCASLFLGRLQKYFSSKIKSFEKHSKCLSNPAKALSLSTMISPLLGLLSATVLILIFGKAPAKALSSFFLDTFTSRYYFGNLLNTASFFMIAGTGSAISIKSGNMNLGGEGQVYIGGFAGCIVLNTFRLPASVPSYISTAVVFLTALLAAAASGAALACISSFLKELRGAKVLLTSFLVSAATIPVIDGLITASKTNSGTNMLALPYIQNRYKLPQILSPSPLSVSFFIAIAVCLVSHVVINYTESGKKMQLWGQAPLFAKYCGYSSKKNSYIPLAISGALHSLCGFFAVTGTYYTCHKDFYVSMGWNALNTALISSSNPIAVIPKSLILAWIFTSASRVSLTQGFGFDIAGIVQGIVLFSIAIPFALSRKKQETL